MKVKVINRVLPCACGCRGRDPWHAPAFKRALREQRDLPPTLTRVRAYREPVLATAEARIAVPWGTARAVFIPALRGWFLAAEE